MTDNYVNNLKKKKSDRQKTFKLMRNTVREGLGCHNFIRNVEKI